MFPFQPRRNPFTPDIYQDEEETPYSSMFKGEAPKVDASRAPSDADLYLGDYERIRKNPGPATSAYRNMLSSVPQSGDFQPGKIDRAAAILTGIGTGLRNPSAGYGAARDIVETPYKTAMRDYSNKMSVTKQAADLEREDSAQQLKALSEARALGLKYDEFKLKRLEDESQAENRRGTLKVNQDRAAAYIKNLDNPDYAQTPVRGGIMLINKKNAKDRQFIPAETVAGMQASTAARNADTNRVNAESLTTYRQVMGAAATKRANVAVDRANKPETAYQQARAVDTALSLMYADKRWNKFIKKSGGGTDVAPYTIDTEMLAAPAYKEFRGELKRQVENALKKGSPFPDEMQRETDSDDDIEVIEGK